MLKLRLTTSVFLISFLVCVWNVGYPWLQLATLGIFSIANFEWLSLLRIKSIYKWLHTLLFVTVTLFLYQNANIYFEKIVVLNCVVWLLAAAKVISFKNINNNPILSNKISTMLLSFVFLISPCFLSLIVMGNQQVKNILIYVVIICATTDSMAYLGGRKFGVRKLCPKVSPNKTIEGLLFGVLSTLLVAYFASEKLNISSNMVFLVTSFVACIFGVFGDLFFSMLKRIAGAKDSGKLLPGHGGVLDRIDSFVAALPIFVMGLVWNNIIFLQV